MPLELKGKKTNEKTESNEKSPKNHEISGQKI